MYRFGILEETGLFGTDVLSTLVSWGSQGWSLMSCGSNEGSWSKSNVQDDEIISVHKEGYTGVNSWFCFECNKQCKTILTSLGKDRKKFTRKDKTSWRKIKLEYLIYSSFISIYLQWSYFPSRVLQFSLKTWSLDHATSGVTEIGFKKMESPGEKCTTLLMSDIFSP